MNHLFVKPMAVIAIMLGTVQLNWAQDLPTEDPLHESLHPLLEETIEAGPYAAQWKSLVKHETPEWFQNDKIGLSAHWGP